MSDENVVETPVEASPETGGAGDKPVESTKQATLPRSIEEMTEDQKAIWMQGAKDYKAYVEREEAKKAAEKRSTRASDNDDPNIPVEKEVEKLVNQALSEAGEGATGAKVLVKSLTKLLLAQTNMTRQMAEEIAETKVAGLAANSIERDANDFFEKNRDLSKHKDKIRKWVEKHGVKIDEFMDFYEDVRPRSRNDDTDEEYERAPRKPKDIDDYSFLETPTKRGETAPAKDPGKVAAELAKKAVEAQKAGNDKDRDKYLNQYMRASRRLRVA